MDPAGLLLTDIGAIPNYQQLPLPRNLLTEIEVFDPITEEGGSREIEYIDGVCDQGVCQGFRERVIREFKRSPRFVAELGGEWVQQSETSIEYLLSRDYAVPFREVIRTDHNRAHLPGGPVDEAVRRTWKTVDTFFQDPNDYTTDAVPNLWLQKRRAEEFAEDGPDTRTWELRLNRNAVGLPTRVRHVPISPSSPEEEIIVRTDWLSNAEGSVYVPARQWTRAWDSEAGGLVRVEQGEFGYDGGALGTGPVTRGLLTTQSVCAGRPASGLCSERLDWDFERTPRGTVYHSAGRDGGYVFEETTVLGFAWGETVAASELNAMGHNTTRGVDHFGRVQSVTDANGVTVLTLHDAFGRETTGWTEGAGGPLRADFVRTYLEPTHPLPRFVTETRFDYDPVSSQQRGRQGWKVMDGFGRPLQSWSRNHDETGFIVVDTITDVQGNVVSTSIPRTEPQLTPGTFQRSPDLMEESYFDAFGATVWTRTDLAPVPTIVRNPAPGVRWTRDGENYRKEVLSDTHGRVVEVREGKGSSTPLVTTGRYTYDGRSRMTSFTDANDNRHRYEWDGAGRLRDVYRDGGLGESPYYSYFYEGPYVVRALEGDGTPAATWEYDALGRTTKKRVYEAYRAAFFDDPAAYATYTWTWDHIDDAQGAATWNGVRHATGDPAGQTRYFYDEYAPFGDRGRLTTVERRNLDLEPLVTHYEHNYAGSVTYAETPGGQFISTSYSNSQWKLEDVVGPVGGSGEETVSYGYDAMGLLDGWSVDDASTSTGSWRADFTRSTPNRLDAVEMGRTELGSERTSVDFSYLDNGWLNTKSIQPPFGTTEYLRYRYDELGRAKSLAYVNAPDTHVFERYTYDDAGNLTHFKQGVGPDRKLWEYAAPVEFGEIPSRIDTRSGVKDTHVWDETTGRLTNWSTVDGAVTLRDRNFAYDGAGRLVYTEQDGEKTTLFYDVDNALVYEDRRGEIYERFSGYRSGPEETIDSVLPMLRVVSHKVGGVQVREPRVVMLDVDGHALFTWDLQGNELSREITGVYGLPLVGPNWDQGELWEIDGLHGSEADRSNELVHFGARHTMFRDGMWMQPEPLLAMGIPSLDPANPGAAGPVLAGGNPIVFADSSGYSPLGLALILWTTEAGEGAQPTLLENFGQGALAGDIIENPNLAQAAGQVAIGLTPVGVAADVRDLGVNAWRGDILGVVLAGVGFVPLVGDGAKIGAKAALRSVGDACFVAGTRIAAVEGSLPIEDVRVGDRVLARRSGFSALVVDGVSRSGIGRGVAAAFTDGLEEDWVKVESDKLTKAAAWSPRGVCSRIAKA
ncbi:MAG TPA: hypothetical protein ENI86_18180, partial [Acidimicrobiales bacterium]|nr:hypothetical protein [Acidimicrobiales bacterium]